MYLQYNKSGTTGDLAGPSKLVKMQKGPQAISHWELEKDEGQSCLY